MFKTNWQRIAKALLACFMAAILTLGLISCGRRSADVLGDRQKPVEVSRPLGEGQILEVSPPEVIQALRQFLERNQPQVKIVSPQPNKVLQDNAVLVKLKVEDLPLFKDAKLGLGPHLQVFLDDQPFREVYDLNQPLTLADLTPGTHTLRIFAAYPWYESFKNEGAYAQTTFHIFTQTQNNHPDPALPLLTYNYPQGSYRAEPIMLDFYLINTPLHLVAQADPNDNIADWQIRCTINGTSFILDRWQSIYLKGFKPGKNWVQLELLDEQENLVQNVFNNPIRLLTYEPGGKDTLSRLMQGELKTADARGIVDPNYMAETLVPAPSPSATPAPNPEPLLSPSPSMDLPSYAPTPKPSPTPTLAPTPQSTPPTDSEPSTELGENEQAAPSIKSSDPTQPGPTEAKQPGNPGVRRFLDSPLQTLRTRFQRPSPAPATTPSPNLPPTLPEVTVTPSPRGDTVQTPELAPSQENPSQPAETPEIQPSFIPLEQPSGGNNLSNSDEAGSAGIKQPEKPSEEFLNRRDSSSPTAPAPMPPTLSEEKSLNPKVEPSVMP